MKSATASKTKPAKKPSNRLRTPGRIEVATRDFFDGPFRKETGAENFGRSLDLAAVVMRDFMKKSPEQFRALIPAEGK